MTITDIPPFTLTHNEQGLWEVVMTHHGRYKATDATLTQALAMERDGMVQRVDDVYDGEWDKAEQVAFYSGLPDIVLAVMVADFTFTI